MTMQKWSSQPLKRHHIVIIPWLPELLWLLRPQGCKRKRSRVTLVKSKKTKRLQKAADPKVKVTNNSGNININKKRVYQPRSWTWITRRANFRNKFTTGRQNACNPRRKPFSSLELGKFHIGITGFHLKPSWFSSGEIGRGESINRNNTSFNDPSEEKLIIHVPPEFSTF